MCCLLCIGNTFSFLLSCTGLVLLYRVQVCVELDLDKGTDLWGLGLSHHCFLSIAPFLKLFHFLLKYYYFVPTVCWTSCPLSSLDPVSATCKDVINAHVLKSYSTALASPLHAVCYFPLATSNLPGIQQISLPSTRRVKKHSLNCRPTCHWPILLLITRKSKINHCCWDHLFIAYEIKTRGRARTQYGSGGSITKGTTEREGRNANSRAKRGNKMEMDNKGCAGMVEE